MESTMDTKNCSKCQHTKPIAEFNKYSRSKDGYSYRCKSCERASNKKWCDANWSKKMEQQRARQQQLLDQLRNYKSSHGCCCCEECEAVCLELHHLDPSVKEIHPADMVTDGWAWSRMLEEIKKCVVVCSNCHKKIHAGLLTPSVSSYSG